MEKNVSRGLKSVFSFQLLGKAMSFGMNALVSRKLSPKIRGLVFTLDIFSITVLSLSRMSFRNSTIRLSMEKNRNTILKSGLLAIPFGLLILFISSIIFFKFLCSDEVLSEESFNISFILYIIGIIFEILSEPFYLISNCLNQYKEKALIEAICLFIGSFLTIIFEYGIFNNENNMLYAFGIGQFGFGLALFLCYLIHSRSFKLKFSFRELWKIDEEDKNLFIITMKFFKHSAVKQIVSEGENYIMMLFEQLKSMGTFDLVSNLGSMVVRIVFQPIEEIAFNTWSGMLNEKKIDEEEQKKNKDSAKGLFIMFMKLMLILGYYMMFFSPAYSELAIELLNGKKWRSTKAANLLTFYSYFVFTLAINGITEAFVRASSNQKQMNKNFYWIFIVSAVYISISILLMYLGTGVYGVIIGNMINMCLRIVYSSYYIHKYFGDRTLFSRIFNLKILLSFILSFGVTFYAKRFFANGGIISKFLHVAIGLLFVFFNILAIYIYDKEFLIQSKNILFSKKKKD